MSFQNTQNLGNGMSLTATQGGVRTTMRTKGMRVSQSKNGTGTSIEVAPGMRITTTIRGRKYLTITVGGTKIRQEIFE